MFETSLFLGFPVNDSYSQLINALDSNVKQLFISENGLYLEEVFFEGKCYIGKSLGIVTNLEDLELLEKNIYSILSKFIPRYTHEDFPLVLFAAQP